VQCYFKENFLLLGGIPKKHYAVAAVLCGLSGQGKTPATELLPILQETPISFPSHVLSPHSFCNMDPALFSYILKKRTPDENRGALIKNH